MRAAQELVGQGRTAEILRWDDTHVVKLFRADWSRESVAWEAHVSRLVYRAGLPAPAIADSDASEGLVAQGGRYGVVYERIDGPTMLRDIVAKPWRLGRYARQFAELHAELHRTRIPALPPQRDQLLRGIDRAEAWLSADLAAKARQRLASLVEGEAVCHGDFHPDNLLMSKRGPVIIDWGPATRGDPVADVARTVLIIQYGGYPVGSPLAVRILLRLLRRRFLAVYLRRYLRDSSLTWRDVDAWLAVAAAARLGDRIPAERGILTEIVRNRLGGSACEPVALTVRRYDERADRPASDR